MKRAMILLIAGTVLSAVGAVRATGQAAAASPVVTITRLACGETRQPRDLANFSDIHAYDGKKMPLVGSCYLIRHNAEYMLWDTGYSASNKTDPKSPIALPATIVEQLRQLGIQPSQIGRIGISHYHADHIGQARDFPGAILTIGAEDWAMLTAPDRGPTVDTEAVRNWVIGGGTVDKVVGDRDIFVDGTVVMLNTPGHTPGHHSLLVRLKKGWVILSGDVAHFAANYANSGVPISNASRAETLASLDRIKRLQAALKATVILQHDPADIAKLPSFPKAAE